MDVFSLREQLIGDYSRFARSFTTILADDLRRGIDDAYSSGRYWPEPLIQINPRYQQGRSTAELAVAGELSLQTAKCFPISLYRHQEQAIAFGSKGESFVVTTGTGSGKSMCFFLPIVDAVLRAKEQDKAPRTRAIVIYPMNALANSQREELIKFLGEAGPVTFARYTGQEDEAERQRIKDNPAPDAQAVDEIRQRLYEQAEQANFVATLPLGFSPGPIAAKGAVSCAMLGITIGGRRTAQQYTLRAVSSGWYPVMRRGTSQPVAMTWLEQGEVWKFGKTINPLTRYSQTYLRNTGNGLIYRAHRGIVWVFSHCPPLDFALKTDGYRTLTA